MSLRKTIVGQFKRPHGFLGRIAGWIMANRQSNQERNSWTVDKLNIQSTDKILEVGCGPGLALEACLARAKEGIVVGLDHSPTMIQQSRSRNLKSIQNGRLELVSGTLDDLPDTAANFDKIYSANVVQFFPDRAAAYRKIFAALKQNGISATTYMPRMKNPTREKALELVGGVADAMDATGFVNIELHELPLDPVPAFCITGERP